MPSIYLVFFFWLIDIISNQNDYFKTLTNDFNSINSSTSTVIISESKDLGPCSCDLTPGVCDYLCCCDSDCPEKVTTDWINDSKNICLDKSIF